MYDVKKPHDRSIREILMRHEHMRFYITVVYIFPLVPFLIHCLYLAKALAGKTEARRMGGRKVYVAASIESISKLDGQSAGSLIWG